MTDLIDAVRRACVSAKYSPSSNPLYAGNEFIEALPPELPLDELARAIRWKPEFKPSDRDLPTHVRVPRLLQLRSLMIPLERNLETAATFEGLLRTGYVGRAPRTAARERMAQALYEKQLAGEVLSMPDTLDPAPLTATVIAPSGSGKTTLFTRWAARLPRVIYHEALGIYQIPVIRVDAPSDGSSIKGLIYGIFQQIDALVPGANYAVEMTGNGRLGADALLANLARVLNIHAVGIVVIDEAQNFKNAHKGKLTVMTELTSACNYLRVPIVFMGTNGALDVLGREFRQARRSVASGLQFWGPLPQHNADGSKSEWRSLVEVLWRLQLVRRPVDLDEEIVQILYACSQGIIAIAIALFAAAQMRAMMTGAESVNASLLQEVYASAFTPVHDMISALRRGDAKALKQWDDIKPLNMFDASVLKPWKLGGSAVDADESAAGPPCSAKPALEAAPAKTPVDAKAPKKPRRSKGKAKAVGAAANNQAQTTLAADDYRNPQYLEHEKAKTAADVLATLNLVVGSVGCLHTV
jgi:hypothetical protein